MSLQIFVLAIKNLLIGNILFVIMGILFNNNPTGSILSIQYNKLSLRSICLTKCTAEGGSMCLHFQLLIRFALGAFY